MSADPHHTCRYGSSPAAHRLVVPVLSFPSDREPSLSHRSRLASFYTRTDQPLPYETARSFVPCSPRPRAHAPRQGLALRVRVGLAMAALRALGLVLVLFNVA